MPHKGHECGRKLLRLRAGRTGMRSRGRVVKAGWSKTQACCRFGPRKRTIARERATATWDNTHNPASETNEHGNKYADLTTLPPAPVAHGRGAQG